MLGKDSLPILPLLLAVRRRLKYGLVFRGRGRWKLCRCQLILPNERPNHFLFDPQKRRLGGLFLDSLSNRRERLLFLLLVSVLGRARLIGQCAAAARHQTERQQNYLVCHEPPPVLNRSGKSMGKTLRSSIPGGCKGLDANQ